MVNRVQMKLTKPNSIKLSSIKMATYYTQLTRNQFKVQNKSTIGIKIISDYKRLPYYELLRNEIITL